MLRTISSSRSNGLFRSLALGLAGLALPLSASGAELVAYYTLDNVDPATVAGSGLKNLGSNGSASDLTRFTTNDASVLANGVIGSALSFAGDALYTTTSTGNAAEDLTHPFTFSIWIGNVSATDNSARAAISVSPGGDTTGNYFSVGVNGTEQVQVIRYNLAKNQTVTPLSKDPLSTTGWYHIAAVVYAEQKSIKVYVDGKNIELEWNSNNDDIGLTSNIDTLAIGGILRQLDGSPDIRAPFSGYLDDAGLFDYALDAADAALINGLGRSSGLGLNWLADAQALNASSVGTIMNIGGYLWQRVEGLTGTTGDWGGSAGTNDAWIITNVGGNGIQMVPEPSLAGGLAAAGLFLMRRPRSRQ